MTRRAEKRLEEKRKQEAAEKSKASEAVIVSSKPVEQHTHATNHSEKQNIFLKIYDKHYKMLMIIPFIVIILALIQIGYHMSTNNGDFINKDISLKGGVSIAVHYDKAINEQELASYLSSKGFSVNVRTLYSGSDPLAILIESDVEINDAATKETLLSAIQEKTGIEKKTYSVETMSAAIGDSFFKDAMRALLISFILMSLVVLFTFRTFIPSAAVILAALSDIIITIAVLNILHVKLSTAGIAALLMLIGYSVDTDILLTSRVLKRKEGTVLDRVLYSIKTGMMMNATAFVVIILGMLLTSSDIIKQIMLILFIGMLADQINTWIQNAGILRWYMEHKAKKQGSEQ